MRSVKTPLMHSANAWAPEGADLGRSIEGSSEHGGPAYARRTFADPAGDLRTARCRQDCTSHSSASLIATRCMDGESKNAETCLPLPQPTRRRVCTGVCVIHFILCGLPELGRPFLIVEQRLFALGAMKCRMRLVLFVAL